MNTQTSESGGKVLMLNITKKAELFAAFMPFIKNGGLFIPIDKEFQLGDEVFILLKLMDDETEKYTIEGKVAWITPKSALGRRSVGIGVQFTSPNAGEICKKIETYLAGLSDAEKHTETL